MKNLKELRSKKGISQIKLANHMNVSRSTVSMWENGASDPDNETLVRLADFFNVSLDYLLGREFYPNRIRELRYNSKMTEQQLADYLGISIDELKTLEDGAIEIDNMCLIKLVKLFKCSADYLLHRSFTDDDDHKDDQLMYALFGGSENVTPEMLDEVKQFAQFVKERESKK